MIPGLGGSPGGRFGNPLQYSSLENFHGWRSLAGYSPWGCRVGKNGATSYCLPKWLNQFTFPLQIYKGSLFSTFSPTFVIVILICISLMISSGEWLFMYLLAICMFSLEKCLFRCSAYFIISLFLFLMLSCMSCLYNLVYWSHHLQVFSPIQQVVFLFF